MRVRTDGTFASLPGGRFERSQHLGRNGGELDISVTDQGMGISAEDLERVFDRMYRLERRLSTDPGGMGLGLALCKALVEAHSGRIWVESKVDKGSTFHFTLPLTGEKEEEHG